MNDSWDEVLDWERWAKEVLTDWRVPFDNHKVGLRLGVTQTLCDMSKERDALAAENAALRSRLAEAEALLKQLVSLPVGNAGYCSYPLAPLQHEAAKWLTDSASVCAECGGAGVVQYRAFDGTEYGHIEESPCACQAATDQP